jgi:hypothetical protein
MRVWLWIIVGCLIGMQPCAASGQSTDMQTRINKLLRSIVPIETTANDVKKLLGEPITKSPDFHEFDDFNVLIGYTTGLPCNKEPTYGWNVPRDRVITFTIIIKAALYSKDLKNFSIDLSKYEKAVDESGHVPETVYTNNEEGISIYIIGDQITSIALFPAKKYLHLMCPKANVKPISTCGSLPTLLILRDECRHDLNNLFLLTTR